MTKIKKEKMASIYYLIIGVFILNLIFQGKSFIALDSINTLIYINLAFIMGTIAQGIIVLTGGIDLSIGSIISLVNVTIVVLNNSFNVNIWLALLIGIIVGVIVGGINGVLISYLRIPPLLTTFAMMSVINGISLLILPLPGGEIPEFLYMWFSENKYLIPNSIIILIAVIFIWALLKNTFIVNYIKAVGGMERNAYLTGIPVAKIKMYAYVISGFISGVAGVCVTLMSGAGDPRIGLSISLNTIAAVILGGFALGGGKGKIRLAILGATFLVLINNSIFYIFYNYLTKVPFISKNSTFYQQLITYVIIIVGLISCGLRRKNVKN